MPTRPFKQLQLSYSALFSATRILDSSDRKSLLLGANPGDDLPHCFRKLFGAKRFVLVVGDMHEQRLAALQLGAVVSLMLI